MIKLNDVFRKSNIYSIEYVGFFNIKTSLSSESFYYFLDNLVIEFTSGIKLFRGEHELEDIKTNIFGIFGLNVENVSIDKEKILRIEIENDFLIESVVERDSLVDRNWIIRSLDGNTYIINDHSELFYSDDFKKWIELQGIFIDWTKN